MHTIIYRPVYIKRWYVLRLSYFIIMFPYKFLSSVTLMAYPKNGTRDARLSVRPETRDPSHRWEPGPQTRDPEGGNRNPRPGTHFIGGTRDPVP